MRPLQLNAFSEMLPEELREVLARLNAAGHAACLVGGCVRDWVMGREPGDYDVATSALPEETERVFSGERVVETGVRHGTVTVLLRGRPIEITTFRVDGDYSDGRHPDSVRFTRTLEEDLARRDFTVNAMAWDPERGLTDPFGGQADLKQRLLRCVGDPKKRFREDALRIMRGLRLASQLDFFLEPGTAAVLVELRNELSQVSRERLLAELEKLLCGKSVRRVLLDYWQVLSAVIPEIGSMAGFDQRNVHHIYDVLEHSARVVEAVPPERVLRLAALLHDVGKPAAFYLDDQGCGHFRGHDLLGADMADGILRRLRCDNGSREKIVTLIKYHDWSIPPTERGARRALNRLGEKAFFALLALKRADNLAQSPTYRGRQKEYDALEAAARQVLARQDCFTLRDLAVNGADLLSAGFPPGPVLGRTLQGLLEAVMDGHAANEKQTLLALASRELRNDSAK